MPTLTAPSDPTPTPTRLRHPRALAKRGGAGRDGDGDGDAKSASVGGGHPCDVPLWASGVLIAACIGVAAFVLVGGEMLAAPGEDIEGLVPKYLDAAFPCFFFLMMLECILIYVTGLNSEAAKYDLADSFSSLAAGACQQLWSKILPLIFRYTWMPTTYVYIYNNMRGHHLECLKAPVRTSLGYDQPWTFLFAFLGTDISYYWFHRFLHTNAVLWAGHSVHHSSDHYNLSTALRQSVWQAIVTFVPYLWMAALGIPPRVFISHKSLNTIYQFWVHTCIVRELPWIFELILSTPSHHRVHHDRRVHKNFGGILIIWDRIFGSFLAENNNTEPQDQHKSEACMFGVSRSVESFSEAVIQTRYWEPVFAALKRARSVPDLVYALVVGPGYSTVTKWRPIKAPKSDNSRIRLKSIMHTTRGWVYMLIQTLAAVFVGLLALVLKLHPNGTIILAFVSISGLLTASQVFNSAKASYLMEFSRLLSWTIACTAMLVKIRSQWIPPFILKCIAVFYFASVLVLAGFGPSLLRTTFIPK